MSSGLPAQSQVGSLHNARGGPNAQSMPLDPLASYQHQIIPSKRSDDDVQFISSKPVKRQRISGTTCKPMPAPTPVPAPLTLTHQLQNQVQHTHNHGPVHTISGVPVVGPTPGHILSPPVTLGMGPGEADNNMMDLSHGRRVSTGMVGLPSDFHDMDPSLGLRGVSLPALENFVLNQPFRKPKPPSPPELSPKQLPADISSTLLKDNTVNTDNMVELTNIPQLICSVPAAGSTNECSVEALPTTPGMVGSPMMIDSPTAPAAPRRPAPTHDTRSSTPPSPTPQVQSGAQSNSQRQTTPITTLTPTPAGDHSTSTSTYSISQSNNNNTQKHPCRICTQMRQQATLARAQGLPMPMGGHNMHGPMVPQMSCLPPLNPHSHPHFMMPPNMPAFGPGYTPMMMPVNINGYNHVMTQGAMPNAQQQQQTSQGPVSPVVSLALTQHPAMRAPESNPVVATTPLDPKPAPAPSPRPCKPPASLIQPTYRKPSPNLIVDVAETCQEKFPFEDVAKRHNIPVEKVFDVFAAIIQVPMLRCATDRRRAGRLATARVKEYNKAKKDMQEARGNGGGGGGGYKEEIVVRPLDVAQHMGPVDLPQGFTLPGPWQ